MIEVAPNIWVGSDEEHKHAAARLAENGLNCSIVHACKEPYHREALGYTGKAAPKEHPEYLVAQRGEVLILNLIDADNPLYIPRTLIDAAVSFIRLRTHPSLMNPVPVLIHCNKGHSRAPVVAMLALATQLPGTFEAAEEWMRAVYAPYNPANGMRQFAIENWDVYRHCSVPRHLATAVQG